MHTTTEPYRMSMTTTDIDQAMSFLNELYGGIDLAPVSEGFSLHVSGVGDDRFACIDEGMTAKGILRTQPQDKLIVLETTEGVYAGENGREILDNHRPALDRQLAGSARWDGTFAVSATHVNADALDSLAADHFGRPGLHVKFTESAPVTRSQDRVWAATSAFAREMVSSDELLGSALFRDKVFNLLARTLLMTFANNTLDLAPATDGSTAVPAAIRRAISYMEENVAQSITLEDIARASRLSPRGLQDAFVRILGTSPTRYLRGLRMEGVRADLQKADPTAGDTVLAISHRWGFVHPARFAASYRDEFGEYPAETLRR